MAGTDRNPVSDVVDAGGALQEPDRREIELAVLAWFAADPLVCDHVTDGYLATGFGASGEEGCQELLRFRELAIGPDGSHAVAEVFGDRSEARATTTTGGQPDATFVLVHEVNWRIDDIEYG